MKSYKSPDGKHDLIFVEEGEVRFGPNYYKVILNEQTIANQRFGLQFEWHPDSTFLALQEWVTTDYQIGPITALIIIDLVNYTIARISIANGGYICPIRFENNTIIYSKEYPSSGKTIEYEIHIEEVENQFYKISLE